MPPRPLYRWKSFWLGLLVLAFIGWAWRDSTWWQTFAHHRQYYMGHAGSGVCIADWKFDPARPKWARYPVPQTDEVWGRFHVHAPELLRCSGDPQQINDYYDISRNPVRFEARNAAARHFKTPVTRGIPGAWALYLPHWLLLLLFLIPWSALLAWRLKKQRIQMKAHAATAP